MSLSLDSSLSDLGLDSLDSLDSLELVALDSTCIFVLRTSSGYRTDALNAPAIEADTTSVTIDSPIVQDLIDLVLKRTVCYLV